MNLSLFLRVQRYNLFSLLQIFFKKFFSASFVTLIFFAGAKVQPFFHSTKYFLKYFFSSLYERRSLIESGCKINTFYPFLQIFFQIFFNYFLNG